MPLPHPAPARQPKHRRRIDVHVQARRRVLRELDTDPPDLRRALRCDAAVVRAHHPRRRLAAAAPLVQKHTGDTR